MRSDKTCFQFELHEEPWIVEQRILNFLKRYRFDMYREMFQTYFMLETKYLHRLCIEYFFQGNILTVYVYYNSFDEPVPLSDEDYSAFVLHDFKNMLLRFFDELLEVSDRTNYSGFYEREEDKMKCFLQPRFYLTEKPKKPPRAWQLKLMAFGRFILNQYKEILTVMGFIVSVCGLVLASTGMFLEMWIVGFELIAVALGMRTKYKRIAITTFLLCIAYMPIALLQVL